MTTRPLAGLLITVPIVDYQIAEKKNTESSFSMQRLLSDSRTNHIGGMCRRRKWDTSGDMLEEQTALVSRLIPISGKKKKSNRFHLTHTEHCPYWQVAVLHIPLSCCPQLSWQGGFKS